MTDGKDGRAPRRRWWRWGRWVLLGLLVVALAVAIPLGITYRRQIWSYATHWKGSPTHTTRYRILPTPQVHVAAVGDIGDSGFRLDATARAIADLDEEQRYNVLLLLGDNVYPSGDPRLIPSTVFEPFAAILDHVKLLAILGNHDVKNGNGPKQVQVLDMPGEWWSYTDQDVLFVGLNSNEVHNPRQLAFLRRTLANSDATWKIVALHHPPYSAGYQGSSVDARNTFGPIFERYGVQLVLSGHDHDYQRSKPINGVTYVVSGAASGTRRTGDASFTAESFSWHHFLDLAIYPDHLVGRAVNQDRRVADRFELQP